MRQSENISKIPGAWRHGLQIATGTMAVIAIALDGFWLFPDVISYLSENFSDLIKWSSTVIGGIFFVAGAYLAYLKNS